MKTLKGAGFFCENTLVYENKFGFKVIARVAGPLSQQISREEFEKRGYTPEPYWEIKIQEIIFPSFEELKSEQVYEIYQNFYQDLLAFFKEFADLKKVEEIILLADETDYVEMEFYGSWPFLANIYLTVKEDKKKKVSPDNTILAILSLAAEPHPLSQRSLQ